MKRNRLRYFLLSTFLLFLIVVIILSVSKLSLTEPTLTPVLSESVTTSNGLPSQPFSTLNPESLQQDDYAEEELDSPVPCFPWPWCENATATTEALTGSPNQ